MFNIFKKRKQNIIEIGVLSPIPPLKQIITPSLSNPPNWWKTFPKIPDLYLPEWGSRKPVQPNLTTQTCPSFVDLFKNSYIIKSPCDWILEVEPNKGYRFTSSNEDIMGDHHHQINKQMNGFSNNNLMNIKITIRVSLRSTSKLTKLLFISPIYYNHNFALDIMPGVLPLTPDFPLPLHINYLVNPHKKSMYRCNAGEVMGMLYCTEKKLPKVEFKDNLHHYAEQTKFKGSHLKHLKRWKEN